MCNIRMPTSTHYYLNFLVLQWVTHAMNLTRYMQAAPLAWSQGVFVRLLCGWWEVQQLSTISHSATCGLCEASTCAHVHVLYM